MISLELSIKAPFHKRFMLLESNSKKVSKNKSWEVSKYKTNVIVLLGFHWTTRQDHAGITLDLGLLGREYQFCFYDIRHWDYKNDKWLNPDLS
jgi:hypothetical protein